MPELNDYIKARLPKGEVMSSCWAAPRITSLCATSLFCVRLFLCCCRDFAACNTASNSTLVFAPVHWHLESSVKLLPSATCPVKT